MTAAEIEREATRLEALAAEYADEQASHRRDADRLAASYARDRDAERAALKLAKRAGENSRACARDAARLRASQQTNLFG